MTKPKVFLLDLNLLLAIAWPNHQFHTAILQRLDKKPDCSWATCTVTQLGFVRLTVNPKIVGERVSATGANELLVQLIADKHHVFLSENSKTLVTKDFSALSDVVLGHKQITDIYLCSLAAKHKATLLTADSGIVAMGQEVAEVELLRSNF